MDVGAIQKIASAVTPAVMVSACGLIALGLDNQAGRMTMRMREMTREYRGLLPSSTRRGLVRTQVTILNRRHRHLTRALLLTYASMFSFVVTSMLYLAPGLPPEAAVGTFTLAVIMLAGVALCALASARLSRDAIVLEEQELELDTPREEEMD